MNEDRQVEEPGSDWRDTPWHRRTKAQRRARYQEAEAARKATYAARRAEIRDQADSRLAKIADERAARQPDVADEPTAPRVHSRSSRAARRHDPNWQAYRALRAMAWMSNIQLALMLAPILLVVVGVIALVVFVAVNL